MHIDTFQNIDITSPSIVALLIIAGFMVGFINTIAGSGTVLTYSLFMFLGLPVSTANGTIRLGVIMQTLTATLSFKRKKVLDIKKGFLIAIPVVIGSILGAQIAITIDNSIFKIVLAFIMISMIVFIFRSPQKWLKSQSEKVMAKPTALQYLIFFFIGLYGGFIHIGVGIFILSALVLNAGYDLVRANALKVMIVFLYSPFALSIFIYNNDVHFGIGLISAIGNIAGALVASKYAVDWGANFLRWFLIVVIILFSSYLIYSSIIG
ncbi:MAG: sulfite exporter TauE/SafE family protein [Bacteroidales bacterium]|nr:sulfite exporter TauE/SafE family protein [Bacteroidales bacterium]